MKLSEMQVRLRGLEQEFKALDTAVKAEARSYTPEETAQVEGWTTEGEKLKADITAFQAQEQAAAKAAARAAGMFASTPAPDAGVFPSGLPVKVVSDPVDRDPEMGFKGFGDYLASVKSAATPGRGMDQRLTTMMAALGGNTLSGEDGGFLVRPTDATEIFKRMQIGGLGILGKCAQAVCSGNLYTENALVDHDRSAAATRHGGIVVYWPGEAGTITASQPKFRQMETRLHKMAALAYLTDEQMQDSDLNGSMLQQLFAEAIVDESEDVLFNGTGVGQPLGILKCTGNGNTSLVSITQETDQVEDTIVTENITKAYARVFAPSKRGSWYCNQEVTQQLEQMTMGAGTSTVPVYLPPGGLADAPNGRLRSRVVEETEHCPALGTLGDIVFVDWSQYRLATKGGGGAVKYDMSIHVAFVTDQTAFRATFRLGGQPLWNAPLTPRRGAGTLSPFVAIASRD